MPGLGGVVVGRIEGSGVQDGDVSPFRMSPGVPDGIADRFVPDGADVGGVGPLAQGLGSAVVGGFDPIPPLLDEWGKGEVDSL